MAHPPLSLVPDPEPEQARQRAASSLREALVTVDSLKRLSVHLWHDVDVPLRLVEALRSDLAHLELHLCSAIGLQPSPKNRDRRR